MSLKKQEKGPSLSPQPSCQPTPSPWHAKHSKKAAQQPLFPLQPGTELHWDPAQSQGHASATLNNCYSMGKIQPRENVCGFWKRSPKSSRENKRHRHTKLLGMHRFSICRFTWDIFITFKKWRKNSWKKSIIFWKILLRSDQFYSKANLAHSYFKWSLYLLLRGGRENKPATFATLTRGL